MKSPEYFVHGTSSENDAEKIKEEGFVAEEGRSTVSSDLIMAFKWADNIEKRKASKSGTEVLDTEKGRIIVMKKPDNIQVDYGEDTDIKVDDIEKKISGFVSRYKSGRRYLALYENGDGGEVVIPENNILMSIVPSQELKEKLDSLRQKIVKLERVDTVAFAEEIINLIEANPENFISDESQVIDAIVSLVVSTVEAEVMQRIRGLWLDVKRAKGYEVTNGGVLMGKSGRSLDDLKGMLDSYIEKFESVGVDIGIEALNRYIYDSVNRMIRELVAERS